MAIIRNIFKQLRDIIQNWSRSMASHKRDLVDGKFTLNILSKYLFLEKEEKSHCSIS
jgi:hypothetical protein